MNDSHRYLFEFRCSTRFFGTTFFFWNFYLHHQLLPYFGIGKIGLRNLLLEYFHFIIGVIILSRVFQYWNKILILFYLFIFLPQPQILWFFIPLKSKMVSSKMPFWIILHFIPQNFSYRFGFCFRISSLLSSIIYRFPFSTKSCQTGTQSMVLSWRKNQKICGCDKKSNKWINLE